jgi:MHS family alpha-ketoglutarate permease-like MFS transporter
MTLGQILGLALLLLLQHTLSETALRAWGWRVPFAVGALGAGAVLWLRRSLPETAVYAAEAAAPAGRGTLRALLRHKREALLVVALTMGGTLAYYTYTTYLTKYLAHTAGLPQRTATLVSLVALLVFAALQPLAGALSDRVGRRPLLIAFALGSTFLTVPLLTLLARAKSFWPALGLSLLALLIVTGYTSVNACVKAELFPTGVRALGVALPYALANAAFGGTAEYVALWFKKAGLESGFAWYVAACAAVSLVVYATMRETRELDLGRQTSPAARTPTGATPTAKAT